MAKVATLGNIAQRQCNLRVGRLARRYAELEDGDEKVAVEKALIAAQATAMKLGTSPAMVQWLSDPNHKLQIGPGPVVLPDQRPKQRGMFKP